MGVVSALLSDEQKPAYIDGIRAEYAKVAEAHARNESEKQRLPLSRARENAHKIDWSGYEPVKPQFFGTKVFETYDLEELSRYIDWTPFFQTWELKGRFPASSMTRSRARRRGSFMPMRRRCLRRLSRRSGSAARGDRLLAGQCRGRRYQAVYGRKP